MRLSVGEETLLCGAVCTKMAQPTAARGHPDQGGQGVPTTAMKV